MSDNQARFYFEQADSTVGMLQSRPNDPRVFENSNVKPKFIEPVELPRDLKGLLDKIWEGVEKWTCDDHDEFPKSRTWIRFRS
jgi:hypothetical protein